MSIYNSKLGHLLPCYITRIFDRDLQGQLLKFYSSFRKLFHDNYITCSQHSDLENYRFGRTTYFSLCLLSKTYTQLQLSTIYQLNKTKKQPQQRHKPNTHPHQNGSSQIPLRQLWWIIRRYLRTQCRFCGPGALGPRLPSGNPPRYTCYMNCSQAQYDPNRRAAIMRPGSYDVAEPDRRLANWIIQARDRYANPKGPLYNNW